MELAGVIEGFYGPPWTTAERLTLLDRMQAWGLNTYLYGPKDDLHHRALWREPYGPAAAADLRDLIAACHARGLRFLYGIGPGLDLRYDDVADRARLRARCAEALGLGADGLALLFDDIPDTLDHHALARWGSLAAAQADVVNETVAWLRADRPDVVALFCPTAYCGRMADARLGGEGYLETIGATLRRDIDICWTGPDIVSAEITVAHVQAIAALLRRPPVLWDNLHANDYDSRRVMCGPYDGRPPELRAHVRGILSNPNTEAAVNFVGIRTLAAFLHADEEWDARAAYVTALTEWQPAFATVAGDLPLDDLERVCDCFYLPYAEGPRAVALRDAAHLALCDASPAWRQHAETFIADATHLRDLCTRLSTLRDRALFHALHRRLWDLREELDLLVRAAHARAADGTPWSVQSDFHRPGTYRGGMIAALQSMLEPTADGRFVAAGSTGGCA